MSNKLADILSQRKQTYGSFEEQAAISQKLKQIVIGINLKNTEDPVIVEGMENILHKISRIANGDPTYSDSWRDIAGYATLVADHLEISTTLTIPPKGVDKNLI